MYSSDHGFRNYIETTFDGYVQADFKFRQFELNYRRYFPDDLGAPLLDVGIGRGEMLSCMKHWQHDNYRGIDISASTVQFCQSLGLPCQLVENTAAWLGEHANQFALITLLDVLEHIEKSDVVPLLAALHAALREKGVLIIQLPNMQAPNAQLQRYNDVTHVGGYIENSLHQVLIAGGFSDIHFMPFNDSISTSWKEPVRLFLRACYWKWVRFTRKINGNIDPEILTPTFFAVAVKS